MKKIVLFLLTVEAWLVLWRHRPTIVGVTGSVGKTSTKEAIATLLGEHYQVRKSPKSYNSEIGVLLAILGIPNAWRSKIGWAKNLVRGALTVLSRAPYPEMLVLEMGVDRPGDFDKLLRWVQPDIAVATAVGETPVHVEFFSGPDELANEKAKLIRAVCAGGTAVVNADDPRTAEMHARGQVRTITYGKRNDAIVRGSVYKLLMRQQKPYGMTFKIDYDGKTMPIKILGAVGEHMMYSLLGAAAVGIALGLNLIEIGEGFLRYRTPPGRLTIIDGKDGALLLDDSYNASPIAVRAALKVLESISARRKIAVLGDMLELGRFASAEHRNVGAAAAGIADVVVAVGVRSKAMESQAARVFYWFPNAGDAAEFLKSFIQEGDLVLVKGSQSMRMEKIVEALMVHPEDAPKLLVRQEAYWKQS